MVIVLLSALIGGGAGGVIDMVCSTNLPNQIQISIHTFLTFITPWSPLLFGVLFLGGGKAVLGHPAVQSNSGNQFFCGIAFQGIGIQHIPFAVFFFLSLILSYVGIIILQQKIVDLIKRINPEKQGSVYDMKFQKKWLDSCDKNEQRQIGQAAFHSFQAVNITCMTLWMALLPLSLVFIGILPFFLISLIFGIQLTVYILASIRLTQHRT